MKKKVILSILTFMGLLFSGFIHGAIPASERAALIALYNSSNGDAWSDHNGWKNPPLHTDGFAMPGTEDRWEGVTVSENHVVALQLPQNQLMGSIPTELSNLSNLYNLDLHENYLSGGIPSELGNLSNLQFLVLGLNQLSGSIPSQLGNLSHLKELWLDNNQLSGSIPAQLGALSNLQYLYLFNNQLSGSIPSQLGNLSQLEILSLSTNQLSGSIPTELGNLKNLLNLDLHSNQLSGSIPSQLGNLSQLQNLYLDRNQLSGNIPSQLGNLGQVQEFILEYNRLNGSIPSQLGNLNQVYTLFLNNNQLSGSIPSQLGNFKYLWSLNLSNNHLEGEIPANLSHLMNLSFIDVGYNCLFASDPALIAWLDTHNRGWEDHQDQCCTSELNLSRTNLYFGSNGQSSTNAQTVLIGNNGCGIMNWSAAGNAAWLSVTPSSGTGESLLNVSVNPAGLAAGNYTGTIIVTDSNAANSPQSISVLLYVYEQGQTSTPFGEFATPLDGVSTYNSVPVTGWVLDDIGVANVKIYNGEAYIGDAQFVEGARPDVQAAFPTYPNNYKAGWGYMLLTHFLPDGGNGTYTLIAKATDLEGNEVTLGSKTITIDNAHSVKPFGAIDTPTQGGTASGKNFVNYGWALTPQPDNIPVDGSTINVYVDGVVKGQPEYNNYRADIAELFPGYANTCGAVGYYYLDTTKLANGVHTIAWTVADNAGNSDGIGSRYFTVQNSGNSGVRDQGPGAREKRRGAPMCAQVNSLFGEVGVIKGYGDDASAVSQPVYPGENGIITIEIKELDRVEIHFPASPVDNLSPLPIGSTLDKAGGVFYWQPGPGFVGEYRFVFVAKDDQGRSTRKSIVVNIKPRQ